MIKRFSAFALALIIIVSLFTSCGGYYPEIKSTDEESKVVMTLSINDERYEVKYELYRALFLTLKSEVDGGDAGVWQGEKKEEYISSVNEMIFSRLGDIFSVFSMAKEIGVDVYSDEYDEMVKESVKASVDGEILNGVRYGGFGGDYDKYLESLKEMYLNYSVQDLLIRYALALDDIYYYYAGDVSSDATLGKLEYTREDVENFYNNDEECVRVYQLYVSFLKTSYTEQSIQKLRDKIAAADTEEEVTGIMIGSSTLGEDLKNGEIIGKYNLDSFYYSSLTKAAFKLSYYETSMVINVVSAFDEGAYVLFRTRKSDEHFEQCYEEIAATYVENKIGEMLFNRTAELLSSSELSDFYYTLDHSAISMDN